MFQLLNASFVGDIKCVLNHKLAKIRPRQNLLTFLTMENSNSVLICSYANTSKIWA